MDVSNKKIIPIVIDMRKKPICDVTNGDVTNLELSIFRYRKMSSL